MPTTLALPRPHFAPLPFLPSFPKPVPVPAAPHPNHDLPHPELLHTLVASQPGHQIAAYHPAGSLMVHGLAIAGAVWLSAVAPPMVARPIVDTTMIMLLQPTAADKPAAPDPAVEKLREERAAALAVIANPPPQGFQTIAVLADIPKDIPPVDLNAKAFDPRDFSGRGVEGGIADGVIGGTGKVIDAATGDGAVAVSDVARRVYTSSEIADPAQVLTQPQPKYPPALAVAGISGLVDLQFVVDTAGRVERHSIKVLDASHEPFSEAAVEAIRASTFRPGRIRGEAIRQLVQQRVRFTAPEMSGL
ncbi:MAG: TonB family protein [Gemmatimonadales bacterium]|jgi:TonB family protein|nr:TonB family protein [Gemmatimonadales bacterium]